MTKRTIEAYESAFRYIHENLIPLRGKAIIIDYEKAMRKALKNVLSSIDSSMCILGCWFHFCQALRRKVAQMSELFLKINSDEKYKDIFRRFQCLPLLPLEHINNTFRDLCKEALILDRILFAPFVNYFNREWMNIVTPKHFCVYKSDKRTTGDAESFNGKMNQLFKAHPGFYLFCETLQKVEVSSSNQLLNYVNGTLQKDTRNKFYKKRAETIEKISTEHRDNPKMMLKLLANTKNKLLYAANEITVDEEDLQMAAVVQLYGNEGDIAHNEGIASDQADDEETRSQINQEPMIDHSTTHDSILHYSGSSGNFLKHFTQFSVTVNFVVSVAIKWL